jgi:thioredoxin-like negative regulator of GroEL
MARIHTYSANEVVGVIAANRGLLLVHFGSPLASSCEFIRKELESTAPLFEGSIRIAEVELPLQDVEVLRKYEIEEIPTLILFRGSEEVERIEKILLPDEFRGFLDACASFYRSADESKALE